MVRGLGRLSVRSQGVVFLLLTVSVLLGGWQTWLAPERLLREARQSRLTAARAELARLRQTTVGLPSLRQEVRSLEARLEMAGAAANQPTEASQHILEIFAGAATTSGVVLTTFSTARAPQGQPGAGQRIQLGIDGGFNEVVAFLARVVSLGRIGSLQDIAIKPAAKPAGARTVSATVVAEESALAAGRAFAEIDTVAGRDPFQERPEAGNDGRPAPDPPAAGAVPAGAGLAALPVDQVTVTGIVRAGDTISAVLQAPNRRTFLAKANDRLLDATIESIDPGGVTFISRQDRGATSSPRPVRKPLGKQSGAIR